MMVTVPPGLGLPVVCRRSSQRCRCQVVRIGETDGAGDINSQELTSLPADVSVNEAVPEQFEPDATIGRRLGHGPAELRVRLFAATFTVPLIAVPPVPDTNERLAFEVTAPATVKGLEPARIVVGLIRSTALIVTAAALSPRPNVMLLNPGWIKAISVESDRGGLLRWPNCRFASVRRSSRVETSECLHFRRRFRRH